MPDEPILDDETTADEPVVDESPDYESLYTEVESRLKAYGAILSKVFPDVDLDAEVDKVGFNLKGEPIYVGDLGAPVAAERAAPAPRPAAKSPAVSRTARNRSKPNFDKMTDAEFVKFFDKQVADAMGGRK